MDVRSLRGLIAAFRKAAAFLAALCVLLPCGAPARAAGEAPGRFIAIVYDDSGSMRYKDGKDALKNYAYANYSLQNLVALMGESDKAKIYRMSDRGKYTVDVKKQADLRDEFKDLVAVKDGRTYAGAIDAALRDGAEFLKGNASGQFLFVLVTDGDAMYGGNGKEITGSLSGLFSGYIDGCGLGALSARARALLLSIGTAEPLPPITGMEEALKRSGIPAQRFTADITDEAGAGERIMAAMTDLAESMAGTHMMEVEPGKPFEVRYPLESLVVMEQFPQSGAATVQGIEGGGEDYASTAFCHTQAPGGVGVASAFSSIKSPSDFIKPGQYTLKASGSARTVVFPKVGFAPDIVLKDSHGNAVAEYRGGKWSVEGISLETGAELSAEVAFEAADGTAVEIGSHVQTDFGSPECFACESTERGGFALRAVKTGSDILDIGFADPAYFQISIPALAVAVSDAIEPNAITAPAMPQASHSIGASAASASPSAFLAPPAAVLWDGWRRWPWWGIEAAALALAAAYAAGLIVKRRIPLETEAFVSGSEDMSASSKLEIRRNRMRRNLMPFGREACALGPLELYPHPKDGKLVVLSSVAVLHGLIIDGKPPQHHKARDKAGDFIIGPENVVGVRENGAYRYYRIVNSGEKVRKRIGKTYKHMRK